MQDQKIILETGRLIIREINAGDIDDLFEMDSDPQVHLYINNKPVKSKDEIREVIKMLQAQYHDNGIARWAVVDKVTNECLGWAGIKYHTVPMNNHVNFYEHGYRFKRIHWGKGYATESSRAILDYGFKNLNTESIYATTDIKNINSKKVLKKLGFRHVEVFDMDRGPTDWFRIDKGNLVMI